MVCEQRVNNSEYKISIRSDFYYFKTFLQSHSSVGTLPLGKKISTVAGWLLRTMSTLNRDGIAGITVIYFHSWTR